MAPRVTPALQALTALPLPSLAAQVMEYCFERGDLADRATYKTPPTANTTADLARRRLDIPRHEKTTLKALVGEGLLALENAGLVSRRPGYHGEDTTDEGDRFILTRAGSAALESGQVEAAVRAARGAR